MILLFIFSKMYRQVKIYIINSQYYDDIETCTNCINKDLKLVNEYSRNDYITQLKRILHFKQIEVVDITMLNYKEKLLPLLYTSEKCCVISTIDGLDFIDMYPGLEVLKYLDLISQLNTNVTYTGANPEFYENTISKTKMKRIFKKNNIPTSDFIEFTIDDTDNEITHKIIESGLKFPLIVKPSIGYASMGITDKAIVNDTAEAINRIKELFELINITFNHVTRDCSVFIERYLDGEEFTVLGLFNPTSYWCTGHVYEPAKRNFRNNRQFIEFNEYWKPTESNEEDYVEYVPIPSAYLRKKLKRIAKDATNCLGGKGISRVDIRSDRNGHLYVLEVNANCGFSFDGESSMSNVLRINNVNPKDFIKDYINCK
jgi:D-alanine-D-alanine ligase